MFRAGPQHSLLVWGLFIYFSEGERSRPATGEGWKCNRAPTVLAAPWLPAAQLLCSSERAPALTSPLLSHLQQAWGEQLQHSPPGHPGMGQRSLTALPHPQTGCSPQSPPTPVFPEQGCTWCQRSRPSSCPHAGDLMSPALLHSCSWSCWEGSSLPVSQQWQTWALGSYMLDALL